MSTQITFTYDGRDYCLEYTKETVKKMEDKGFSPQKILEAPITYLPELFRGAFLANHQFTNRRVIDAIYDAMEDREELVNVLIKMYNEPIKALTENSNEGNGVKWTMG